MSEPKVFTKGDHIQWSRPIENSTHTYQYIFLSAEDKHTIDATVVGSDIQVDLLSADSAVFGSAEYHWFLFSFLDGQRYQVADGYVLVNQNPSSQLLKETTTHAERVLASIEKRIVLYLPEQMKNYLLSFVKILNIRL